MHHPFIIWGGAGTWSNDVTGNDVTGSCITGDDVTRNDVTGSEWKWRHRNRKWKEDNFPRFFLTGFLPRFFQNFSRFYVRTMELWIQPVSGHYSAITPYAKPFFPPKLCSQPWLITLFTMRLLQVHLSIKSIMKYSKPSKFT